jgi:adenylate cyclase
MADTRKLAAIMAIDVVGYSLLMGEDEAGTARAVREHLDSIRPLVAGRRGRIFKTMGDGALSEFQSIVDAVECAIAIQELLAGRAQVVPTKPILYRIGIHLGDVLVDGDDLIGDGINVAARLEALCEPGGVLISGSAHEHVLGRVRADFIDVGERQLKNIARPIRAYQVAPRLEGQKPQRTTDTAPANVDAPTIAVIPFQNVSGDREQEYFSDGIADELIVSLSRFPQFQVAARNSSFSMKGRLSDVKQMGRDLGARYIVEGSVRSSRDRIRLSVQLVDTQSGTVLFGDRFDGSLDDVFELQDAITQRVVGSIAPRLEVAEIQRASRKRPSDLRAYDLYLRSLPFYYSLTPAGLLTCLDLLKQAIGLDPKFATAKAFASICIHEMDNQGTRDCTPGEFDEAIRFAREAISEGRDDIRALTLAGQALAYLARDWDAATAALDRALSLNSYSAQTWRVSGWVRLFAGDTQTGKDHLKRSIQLGPRDSGIAFAHTGLGVAHFMLRDYEAALRSCQTALEEAPRGTAALRVMAASLALLGRINDAHRAIRDMLAISPRMSMDLARRRVPYRDEEFVARYFDALRSAGLPEHSNT